ncbi:MAG TPA: hypothetical protein EYH32_06875, partial [Anaerolineae bacterium]|nr:hypothetical protein [Anaerolineae bacterium]
MPGRDYWVWRGGVSKGETLKVFAYVLSGGGNYGAMQAGALEVLLAHGLRPQMLVGTSAGALNAVYLATDPTPDGARRLADAWRGVRLGHMGSQGLFTVIRRMLANADSMYLTDSLARYLREQLPPNVETFGDLAALAGVRAYAVAVRLDTGQLRVFGDDPADRVLDGMMASTAVPLLFPPWTVDGVRYVDGGVLAKLPIRVAVERGATDIVALDVKDSMGGDGNARGMMAIIGRATSLMTEQQVEAELAWARSADVRVRHLPLIHGNTLFWDFTRADELIALGQAAAEMFLEQGDRRADKVIMEHTSRLADKKARKRRSVFTCDR